MTNEQRQLIETKKDGRRKVRAAQQNMRQALTRLRELEDIMGSEDAEDASDLLRIANRLLDKAASSFENGGD